MILLMVFVINIVPSDAMMPLAPLAGALTKQQIVTGVLVSLNLISLTESAPEIIDDILSLPEFLNFDANDYPIVYTPGGEYAFLIGQRHLDAIYATVTGDIPYGTTVKHGAMKNYTDYFIGIPQQLVGGYLNTNIAMIRSYGNHVIASIRPDGDWLYVVIYGSADPYIIEKRPSQEYIGWEGSSGAKIQVVYKKIYGTQAYEYNKTNQFTEYTGGSDEIRGGTGKGSLQGVIYSSDSLIIPDTVWNENYIKPSGINYTTWPQQVAGGYAIKIPTKNEIDPITENEIAVVDEDTLVTLTPDDVRVPDRVTEVVPVPDPIPTNPYDPTIPVTDPVTEPITDVASDTWIDRLLHKFLNLFILPDSYLTDNFNSIRNEVPMLDFPRQIIDDLDNISKIGPGVLEDIKITYWGKESTVVSFAALRDNLPTFHSWIKAVVFILLLLYNYSQVYKLIRGETYGFINHITGTADPGLNAQQRRLT